MAVSKKIQLYELLSYCYWLAAIEIKRCPGDVEEDCPFVDGMTVKQVREWIEHRLDMYLVLLACALQESQKSEPEN